jgi:ubiquinone/menaquinone biosynthesis C-methylase UbiE
VSQIELGDVAVRFDRRASTYNRNDWHRRSAERLVDLLQVASGDRVLDAGTGTGFAAIAAARKGARVVGVDLSSGMLELARRRLDELGLDAIELVNGDATALPQHEGGSFDVVIGATVLLYMPADQALREWRRLLRPGGSVGLSVMKAGSPRASEIFRACARRLGAQVVDPSAPLGSLSAVQAALRAAGFDQITLTEESIDFMPIDLSMAWESNLRSAGHEAAQVLSPADQDTLKATFFAQMSEVRERDEQSLLKADMLYAVARR